MNNFILMKINERFNNLRQIVLNFHLCEFFSLFNKLIECLTGTNLEQNVNIFLILKYVLKFNDIGMCERFMYFNFCDKLYKYINTFCFALDLFNELFAIIFAA
jgi:hypothetical protein